MSDDQSSKSGQDPSAEDGPEDEAIDFGEETAVQTGRVRKHKRVLKRREVVEDPDFEREPDFEADEVSEDSMGRYVLYGFLIFVLLTLGWLTFAREFFLGESAGPESPKPPDKPGTVVIPVNVVAARDMAIKFLGAETVEEKLKCVRSPDRVRNSVESFYREGPTAADEYTKLIPLGRVTLNGLEFARFQVVAIGKGVRLLCVVGTSKGPLVDWETYIRFNPSSWEELLSGKNSFSAPFRCALFKHSFHAFEYADSDRFASYRIQTDDLELPIIGYVEKGTELALELEDRTHRKLSLHCILQLRTNPESGTHRQVLITGLLQVGWVQPENFGGKL